MVIALAAVVLVLAAAIVLLFAMVAELQARIPAAGAGREPVLEPLEEARLGEAPREWPPELAPVAGGQALLLVLSSACASCEDVAHQIATELDAGELPDTAVLVSCGERGIGEDFAARHGLLRMPCHVDAGGGWVRRAFGVQTSPSALLLRDGRLESALVFTDLSALRERIPIRQEAAA